MASLDRNKLRKLIKLEMKTLMDEDALFMKRDIPGDYDNDVLSFRNANSIDLPDEYYTTDYEDDLYPYGSEDEDCFPDEPQASYMKIRLDEGGSDCGCHSNNPYEEEREDYGHEGDPLSIVNMHVVEDELEGMDPHEAYGQGYLKGNTFDKKSSSYMARPQLYKIAKYASALLDMVDEDEELDDWQESKIAQISQMIGSVYHSLDYDEEYDDHDDMDVHDLIGMIRTGNI
jgi:hypothetical protein